MATKPDSNSGGGYTDLGKMPMGMTGSPIPMPLGEGREAKPHYPSICICTDKPLDIGNPGEEGECSIKYSVEECTERMSGDGKKEYRYELDVLGIKPTGKPSTPNGATEPKLPKGFKDAIESGMSDAADSDDE